MDPIPISDITNIRPDADAAGATGAVLPASNAAQYISDAAQARASFNNYVAAQHEKRLNDIVNQVNGLDFHDAFAQDMPGISQQYAGTMKDIADNYDVISDPTSNIQKYGEFKQRLANLQSNIMTSKAHNAIYNENQKMMMLHPEFNTDENQQLMNNFSQAPMDQRKDFMLKTPNSFDPTAFANAAIASTRQVTNTETLSPNKHYIINSKGESYDPDEYVQNYASLLNSTMVNGRTGMDNLKALYARMPADADGTKPSFDDVLRSTAMANLPKNATVTTFKPNEVAMSQDRINEQDLESKRQTALGYAKLAQDGKALKQNEIKPEDGAEAKYLAMHDVLSGSGLNPEFGQNIYGSDPTQDITFQSGGNPVFNADGTIALGQMTPIVKQKVPKEQFVSAAPDGSGGVRVTINENSLDKTGKIVSKPVVKDETYDQMKSSFNRIYGNKFTPQIASGSSGFNKKKLNTTNPTFDDLDQYFKGGTNSPAQQQQAAPAAVPHKKKYNPATQQFE